MAIQKKTVTTGDYAWESWSNSYVISLTLTEESVDVATNTSLVSYLFTISNTNNNRFISYNNTWTISIGGQNITLNKFDFNLGSNYTTQTIASGQVTVGHNADGTLHMPYNVSIPNIKAGNQYGPPAMSLSGTWELTPIPRASSISCASGTIGKPVTISIHKAGEGLNHTVTYWFGSLKGTVAEGSNQSEIQWTIPTEFYTQIPSVRRGQGSLICKTYSGSTLVGESSCAFYADVEEAACIPAISGQVIDGNATTIALTGDRNVLIRYCSSAQVTAQYSAKNSATVASYTMLHNGKIYNTSPTTIQKVESGAFDFSVTDSRGFVKEVSVTKTMIPYVKLTCDLENNKPDTDGNMVVYISGNYFNGSFGATANSLTVEYRYKRSDAAWTDSWQRLQPSVSGNLYAARTTLSGLDYQKSYTFQARAVDKLETVYSAEYTTRATPVFDWGEKDFAIHGDLQVDGSVLLSNKSVLNTPYVRTHYWVTDGAVSLDSVGEFMGSRAEDCAFITLIRGNAYPFLGVAVGMYYAAAKAGAAALLDYGKGVRYCRMVEGKLYTD